MFFRNRKVETTTEEALTLIKKHLKKGRKVVIATQTPSDYKGLGAHVTNNLLEFADEAENPNTILVLDCEITDAETYFQSRGLTNSQEPYVETGLLRSHLDRFRVWNDTLQGFFNEAIATHKRKNEDFEEFNRWARTEVKCRFDELRKVLDEREDNLIIVQR